MYICFEFLFGHRHINYSGSQDGASFSEKINNNDRLPKQNEIEEEIRPAVKIAPSILKVKVNHHLFLPRPLSFIKTDNHLCIPIGMILTHLEVKNEHGSYDAICTPIVMKVYPGLSMASPNHRLLQLQLLDLLSYVREKKSKPFRKKNWGVRIGK